MAIVNMKDYLEKHREELKERGAKGFMPMETLNVVAIIAILIAIDIPAFTSQLESSWRDHEHREPSSRVCDGKRIITCECRLFDRCLSWPTLNTAGHH